MREERTGKSDWRLFSAFEGLAQHTREIRIDLLEGQFNQDETGKKSRNL
jgi:hypothetical protein